MIQRCLAHAFETHRFAFGNADRHRPPGRKWSAARWTQHVVLGIWSCLIGCTSMHSSNEVIHLDGEGLIGDRSLLYRQAMHAYAKGNIAGAIEKFQLAIETDPNNGAAFNNLGLIYYEQRKLVLAANHFDRATELLPGHASPLNNLGMALEAGGRLQEAIELYEQANALEPDLPLYLGNLLRARIRLGERNEHITSQLQHLAFIETREEWVDWVDEQLALFQNPMLDRGPTPGDGLNQRRQSEATPSSRMEKHEAEEILTPIVPAPVDPLELSPSVGAEILPLPTPTPPLNIRD